MPARALPHCCSLKWRFPMNNSVEPSEPTEELGPFVENVAANREFANRERVQTYLRNLRLAHAEFIDMPFLWRVRVNDTATLTAQIVLPIAFAAWWFVLPSVKLADISMFAPAYADAGVAG